MKPKLLFMDDNADRLLHALELYGREYDVTLTTNVKDTMRRMSRENFAVVDLDHDLNGEDFVDPDSPYCGTEIVRYFEKTAWPMDKPRPLIWVHSSNHFAAQGMIRRMIALTFYVKLYRMPKREDGTKI